MPQSSQRGSGRYNPGLQDSMSPPNHPSSSLSWLQSTQSSSKAGQAPQERAPAAPTAEATSIKPAVEDVQEGNRDMMDIVTSNSNGATRRRSSKTRRRSSTGLQPPSPSTPSTMTPHTRTEAVHPGLDRYVCIYRCKKAVFVKIQAAINKEQIAIS